MAHKAHLRMDRQVSLPLKKSIEIAYKSIRVRFFRSLLTILSLVLAVAFLSFVRVGNDLANGLLATGNPQWRHVVIQSGYDVAPNENRTDNNPKQQWLIILSLLVCAVGIVNAQLMAVTERFREIGTMKCLGALDRFVLRLFLLEAAMQGSAGAAMGAIIGAICALLNAAIRFGGYALVTCRWTDVGISVLYASLAGCGLSMIGVLYPALVAAHMQPVEAMRTEE